MTLSKAATTMDDDIVARVKNSLLEFDSGSQLVDEFDQIKSIERGVSKQVENSTLLADEGKFELALKEAEEATKALDSLKLAILRDQQQRSANASCSGSSRPSSSANMSTDKNSDQNDINQQQQPMTTGVNLFDLSIMVKCNLATQLKNNGQLESSLQLYTQLCKMAIDQIGSGAGGAGSSSFISDAGYQQPQQQQSRYLLHRFGLNIGNILCELKEHQRALKYYRLTLDRLSSLSSNRNLQIKLMNNITIALMAVNGIPANNDNENNSNNNNNNTTASNQPSPVPKGTSALASLSKTNDHVTSLQLLLNDNSFETPATTTSATATKQQQQTILRRSAYGGTISGGGDGGASAEYGLRNIAIKQVLNSNHHKFGLNLIVCQCKNLDLGSVYSTLRSLVQVDGCGFQYKRVFDFDKLDIHDEKTTTMTMTNHQPAHEQRTPLFDNKSAHATTGYLSNSGGGGSQADPNNDDQTGVLSSSSSSQPASDGVHNLVTGSTETPASQPTIDGHNERARDRDMDDAGASNNLNMPPSAGGGNHHYQDQSSNQPRGSSGDAKPPGLAISAADRFRQVMSIARADELESLIRAKEREIHRTLITSCNLAIDLDRRARRERLREQQQQLQQQQAQQQRLGYLKQRQNYQSAGSRSPGSPVRVPNRNINNANNLADGNEERPGTKRDLGCDGGGAGVDGLARIVARETSALSQCIKLVATSDLYKGLTEDLLANSVSRLLLSRRRGGLLNALYVFERIALNQQVGAAGGGVSPAGASLLLTGTARPVMGSVVDSGTSKSQRLAHSNQIPPSQHTASGGGGTQAFAMMAADCKSALVATNLGLFYLLRNQINISLELNRRALALDKFNVESLVNMANCHLKLNEMQQAELYYATASKAEPGLWTTRYNRMLLSVKLKQHPDDIDDDLSSSTRRPTLSSELNSYKSSRAAANGAISSNSSFAQFKMALTQVQLVLLFSQSGMIQRSSAILNEMLAANWATSPLPPELFLMASKSLPASQNNNNNTSNDVSTKKQSLSPISMLQQALSIHPYHIPLAERLIALYINDYDYKSAISILTDCIRNRPDQVKWYQMLAECYRRGADYNEAIKIYKHTIELFPLNETCVKALAKLADELGLTEERAACQARLERFSLARGDDSSV